MCPPCWRSGSKLHCSRCLLHRRITGALTVGTTFNTWGNGDPVDCIFYVNNSSIRDTLYAANWGTRNAKKIFAVTNGGILPENVAFTAGKLATPVKDGYIFAGACHKTRHPR